MTTPSARTSDPTGGVTRYPFGVPCRLALDPKYAEARDAPGLLRVRLPYGRPAWLATRYEDVRTVLTDNRFSRARAVGPGEPRVTASENSPDVLLSMDPPRLTRVRRIVTKAFTVRRVEALRPPTRQCVDRILVELQRQGPPADLVGSLAMPLPITVICLLLGIPDTHHLRFRAWVDNILAVDAGPATHAAATGQLESCLAELIAARRERPGSDLLSALVRARDDEHRLTENELVKLSLALLVGGYHTTAHSITNLTYAVLTHPASRAQLKAEPALVVNAVDELLRFTPLNGAAVHFARMATVDIEVGGTTVRAGEFVVVATAAADRDERKFAQPDRLDFTRPNANAHLRFGQGPHHCVGAQLARMELQVAISALLSRFPEIRLAVAPAEIDWPAGFLRGARALPVTW